MGSESEHDEGTSEEPREGEDRAKFDSLPDGSGCTEIWEHLSDRRRGTEREGR